MKDEMIYQKTLTSTKVRGSDHLAMQYGDEYILSSNFSLVHCFHMLVGKLTRCFRTGLVRLLT